MTPNCIAVYSVLTEFAARGKSCPPLAAISLETGLTYDETRGAVALLSKNRKLKIERHPTCSARRRYWIGNKCTGWTDREPMQRNTNNAEKGRVIYPKSGEPMRAAMNGRRFDDAPCSVERLGAMPPRPDYMSYVGCSALIATQDALAGVHISMKARR